MNTPQHPSSLQLQKSLQRKGESLVEVLIAITLLTLFLTAVFGLLNQSLTTNTDIKNRVIALNIAREGIEGIRNIRDTNWLKYSGDRRGKWLCFLEPTDAIDDPCATPFDRIPGTGEVFFRLDYDQDRLIYTLEPISAASLDLSPDDPSEGFENFLLYQQGDPEDPINNPPRFTHQNNDGGGDLPPSIFFRQIELHTENPYAGSIADPDTYPDFCKEGTDTDASCKDARLNVVARVSWREDDAVRSVTLQTYLFDFFERNGY